MSTGTGWEFVAVGGGAFFGVLARAARWVTPEGKFDVRKAIFELMTAPGCGMIAAAIGTHFVCSAPCLLRRRQSNC